MEYTILKLAKMAGVSTRTLRWYDECGLLKPRGVRSNGYRIYGQAEVDRLQQILFYREMGVELGEIKRILSAMNFDGLAALEGHRNTLQAKRAQLDALIANVDKSIKAMKGDMVMNDNEKFEGFKRKLIQDNEERFGEEIRAKYGDEAVNRSNAKLQAKTKEQYGELEALTEELCQALKTSCAQGDPGSEEAQRLCELHKRWLCHYWTEYSAKAHLGVTQMYVDDPRFAAYYENITPGGAVFLRDAVKRWLTSTDN